jgi:hypothetical protein
MSLLSSEMYVISITAMVQTVTEICREVYIEWRHSFQFNAHVLLFRMSGYVMLVDAKRFVYEEPT